MPLVDFATTLQSTALGAALRDATPATVLLIQIGHVLGLILLLTALLLVNLHLLGWGLRRQPLRDVVRGTRWALRLGLVLTIGSGSLLFLTAPVSYIANPAFVPKIALLLAALALQAGLARRLASDAPLPPLLARGSAALGLTLWFGVGLAGRAIGFV
ncbi:hypothetical protein ACHMW6_20260 [Pseudoduganella sp. UC29_106]|uniref:hypothetical protein n=1 Tax=Pseudoduganella sp. UC29_106 TaxID=3374553 RepID=UPI00375774D7